MMHLFRQYCKSNVPFRFPAMLLLLILAVWWLQNLPWQSMAYLLLLASAAVFVHVALDFSRYVHGYRRIQELQVQAEQEIVLSSSSAAMGERGLDASWLSLVRQWQQCCLDEKEKSLAEKKKNSRYYTLWSHQIKTPIAAMHLLLQEEETDRPSMEQELQKAEQYVNMALQYQRLDQSGRDLVLKNHQLDVLVKTAVKQMASVFIYQKVSISLDIPEALVLTDEKWFLFILEQVLGNAIKYAPKGEIRMFLTNSAEELVIEDNGIGIRQEDIPRVFEWGYTGLNGRQEKRSTGIGLFLCRQAMDMLGQTIRIESEAGKGTRVYLGISKDRFSIE